MKRRDNQICKGGEQTAKSETTETSTVRRYWSIHIQYPPFLALGRNYLLTINATTHIRNFNAHLTDSAASKSFIKEGNWETKSSRPTPQEIWLLGFAITAILVQV